MPRPAPHRSAFSMFELLVLLFILGLLFALLLPAIARVREAANRMACGNNLKMLGLAAHNYHDTENRFPPGYLGPIPSSGRLDDKHQNLGSIVLLLPYMEQDALFKQIDAKMGLKEIGPAWWSDPVSGPINLTVASNRIKMLRCPSDKAAEPLTAGVIAASHNQGLNLESIILPKPNAETPAWTNYTGVAGCLGAIPPGDKYADYSQFAGILGNRTAHSLAQILDGSSNTLLFGEGLGGMATGPRDRAWSWMGVGAMITYYGLSPNPPATDPPTAHWRFGSRHRSTAQFAFADGSVRGIRFGKTAEVPKGVNINMQSDWLLLQQLAGMKDGLAFDTEAILD